MVDIDESFAGSIVQQSTSARFQIRRNRQRRTGRARLDDITKQMRRKTTGGNRLDQHLNIPAAGQANVPSRIVGNAISAQHRRRACQNHVCAFKNIALNTAARNRTHKAPVRMHKHMGANRAWRGFPCFDHRRNRHRRACPVDCGGKDTVVVGAAHSHGNALAKWQERCYMKRRFG